MYYNFFNIIKELSTLEENILNVARNVDKIEFNDNNRGVVKFNKSIYENILMNIDKNINAFNKGYQNDFLSFVKVSSSTNEYVCYFDNLTYIKNLKLEVDNFSYELSVEKPLTNFEVFIETDMNELNFFAIPYTHIGDYTELVLLSSSEKKSKFKCKNSYAFKVYDRNFKIIEDSAIKIGADGYINIPTLSGDEAYLLYTPHFDSYEYKINRLVKSIFIKTNVNLDASTIRMVSY